MVEKLKSIKPPKLTFGKHESFHIREGWIPKFLSLIKNNPKNIKDKNLHMLLGIGKNMAISIKHWIVATKLVNDLKNEIKLTELGDLLYNYDPYLEDTASLWVIHINLATNKDNATTWYWAFNDYMQGPFPFNELDMLEELTHYINSQGLKTPSINTIKKDIQCFRRTYLYSEKNEKKPLSPFDNLNCPLNNLDLLRKVEIPNHFKFNFEYKRNLPEEIFLYGLLNYYELNQIDKKLPVSFEDLLSNTYSPGKLFKLNEVSMREYLDRLLNKNFINVIRSTGLDQIIINNTDLSSNNVLKLYFER